MVWSVAKELTTNLQSLTARSVDSAQGRLLQSTYSSLRQELTGFVNALSAKRPGK